MENLQFISIFLELIVGIIAILAAFKGKKYMFGLAFTFLVYVVYDFSKIYLFNMGGILPVLFFLSTVSALWSVWNIYKQN